MKLTWTFCTFLLIVAFVASSPIVKRQAEEELDPLNEVYLVEADDDEALDGERSDRDKRKIGIVKLGISNGILNFVFTKLDSFLDAKTRALVVLDESNKAKNAAFGIDNTKSATTQFLSNLISQKIQAGAASIGPIINSATTLVSGTKAGLAGAVASKLAPLSALSGAAGSGGIGASLSAGGSGGSPLIGQLLTTKLNAISSLSGSSGGLSAGAETSSGSTGADVSLGAFANIGGGDAISTTTEEDIPEFDRTKVSLDVPPQAFGTGFTLITNISKIISSVITNSARRTQTLLEIFKPFFRGVFAIKGLPSDDP